MRSSFPLEATGHPSSGGKAETSGTPARKSGAFKLSKKRWTKCQREREGGPRLWRASRQPGVTCVGVSIARPGERGENRDGSPIPAIDAQLFEDRDAAGSRNGEACLSTPGRSSPALEKSAGSPSANPPIPSLSQTTIAFPANRSRSTRSWSRSASISRALRTRPICENESTRGGSEFSQKAKNSTPELRTRSPARPTFTRTSSTEWSPLKSAAAHRLREEPNGEQGSAGPEPACAVPAP